MAKEKKLQPEHEAKRNVLSSLSKEMSNSMQGKLKGDMEELKKPKISVAADTPEDLEKGVEVAKKLAPKMEDMAKDVESAMKSAESEDPVDMDEMAEEHMEEEHEPSEEHADKETDELVAMLNDPDRIEAVMQKLAEKKKSLKA